MIDNPVRIAGHANIYGADQSFDVFLKKYEKYHQRIAATIMEFAENVMSIQDLRPNVRKITSENDLEAGFMLNGYDLYLSQKKQSAFESIFALKKGIQKILATITPAVTTQMDAQQFQMSDLMHYINLFSEILQNSDCISQITDIPLTSIDDLIFHLAAYPDDLDKLKLEFSKSDSSHYHLWAKLLDNFHKGVDRHHLRQRENWAVLECISSLLLKNKEEINQLYASLAQLETNKR